VLARELHVATRHELAIVAGDLGKTSPHFSRAPREWELGQVAPLLAHAAVVDAARLASARPAFEQDDGCASLAQMQRGGASGDAAADDRDVGYELLGHGVIGIGFTGACPRKRPMSCNGTPSAAETTAAADGLHVRP